MRCTLSVKLAWPEAAEEAVLCFVAGPGSGNWDQAASEAADNNRDID